MHSLVITSPNSRQIWKVFSLPSAFIRPSLISCCRLRSASKWPFGGAACTLFAYCTAFGPADEPAVDAGHQRIRAQSVGAVVLVFGLASGENSGNVRGLLVIHPESAHGVVHAGENLHRHIARIVADKLLVDFENAFELLVERSCGRCASGRDRPSACRRCRACSRTRP